MRKSAFMIRAGAVLCLSVLSLPALGNISNAAEPAYKAPPLPAKAGQTGAAGKQADKDGGTAAEMQNQTIKNNAETGFSCTAIYNISKTEITAYGVRISNMRARAIPGIAGGFNLFEVSYKVLNANSRKIWISGEFIFGYDGKPAGAVSTASGLAGILPNEAELLKGTVISSDIFFKTQNFCFRFNVEQQKL